MGILTRATKNLSRRKTRALIVIAALTLALTMLIILPPSINAREALTRQAFNGLISTDSNLNATVTMSATEIQCDYPLFFNTSIDRQFWHVEYSYAIIHERFIIP